MANILLIDDDVEFCQLLAQYLSRKGMTVRSEHDGQSGLRAAQADDIDLILLDIMLPKTSGLDVLREIRGTRRTPVLMLTALGDEVDRIVGLELGADDYLGKPCNPREVAARISAILRRAQTSNEPRDLQRDDLVLKRGSRQLWRGEEQLEITSTEFSILEQLMANAGRVVSKNALSEQALGRPLGPYDRSLDMHLSNLRKKVGPASDGGERIETIRGVGYQWLAE